MSLPYSDNSLDSVLRLSGLKNTAGKRKVMPDSDVSERLDEPEMDLSGISSSQSSVNTPELDSGGSLNSQSYDVRANSVIDNQDQGDEQGSIFGRLGRALVDYVSPSKRNEMAEKNRSNLEMAQGLSESPPIETEQVDMQEGLPPVSASQEDAFISKFPQAARNMGMYNPYEDREPYNPEPDMNAPIPRVTLGEEEGIFDKIKQSFTPSLTEDFARQFPEAYKKMPEFQQELAKKEQIEQEKLDLAQQNPYEIAVYGATDQFANSPELVREFSEYTGINFDDQIREKTKEVEKILDDVEKGFLGLEGDYSEEAKRLKERILSNQATDQDKFFIGLALAMPLIIGGMFGKEAGLGALGGAAKGVADVYGQRQKNIREDESLLSDITKQRGDITEKRGNLQIERTKIPDSIKKSLPKDEYEDMKGMNIVTYTDPKTGKMAGGVELLPDFIADLSYGNTPEKRKEMRSEAVKLEQDKSALERANEATANVIKAASQLKDPSFFGKMMALGLSDNPDMALKKIMRQNAPMINVDGRSVNSAVYIDIMLEQIKDSYRRSEQMKAFTNTVANHVGSMAENPQYSGLTPADLVDQMLILRDRAQKFFVDRAASQGFLKEPIEQKLKTLNQDLYKGMNRKEEQKSVEADKKLLMRS